VVAISERIIQLLEDKHLRASMGSAGRQWAVEEWGWQRWSEAFNRALKINH
jgi:glycosyltransferase involved in cell wall biosynthesis